MKHLGNLVHEEVYVEIQMGVHLGRERFTDFLRGPFQLLMKRLDYPFATEGAGPDDTIRLVHQNDPQFATCSSGLLFRSHSSSMT